MARNYRLEPEGDSLYRVIVFRGFKTSRGQSSQVHKGDRGKLASGPHNPSHRGRCWIEEGAKVIDQAKVPKDGLVLENPIGENNAPQTEARPQAPAAPIPETPENAIEATAAPPKKLSKGNLVPVVCVGKETQNAPH